MRRKWMAVFVCSVAFAGGFGSLWAKPDTNRQGKKDDPKTDKSPVFKPIEINSELTEKDPKDAKLDKHAKEYTIKLVKDKTYIIDLVSKDFDTYLRLLDKEGNQLDEDDDSGGDTNARIIHAAAASGEYKIVATTFDGQLGKFNLKVREFILKGEAKPRAVGKDGVTIDGQIGQNDVTPIGKFGKVYSVQLKAGQSYTIDLESQAFDSYLYLFDGKNKLLAQDDDGGGGLNSRIVFKAERDGVYHLLASSLDGQETGAFTLKISKD